ncbi:EAL domain-containing protein [Haliangium sp.]|uniref:EAL domain-containing protein n=1 Tax=Haliangium sp. TaxID=2663208 RepID=UPI003D0AAD01
MSSSPSHPSDPSDPRPPGTAEPAPPRASRTEGDAGDQFTRDLADLEQQFERALGSISMAFQPIVYARSHALFGYEALLRSNDPDLPHAGALLDAAERLHRMARLGRVVRRQVAETFGQADDSLGLLFVNLHALDLLDRSLSSRFSPLAKIAHRVVLEVTERSSLDDVSDIVYRVAELRELGFRIAIDDLGAGHNRMDRFTLLDTDFVKLDMALVRDIHTHTLKRDLVASVIGLCHDHEITVIGEGVESEDEAQVLVEVGCDLLQGYHIARPGPPFIRPPLHGDSSR